MAHFRRKRPKLLHRFKCSLGGRCGEWNESKGNSKYHFPHRDERKLPDWRYYKKVEYF